MLAGLHVNIFTFEEMQTCLANPKWDFTRLIVVVLVGLELLGLWWSVTRDRIELRFIEVRSRAISADLGVASGHS